MKLLWGLVCVSALRVPVGDRLLEKQQILDKFRFRRNAQNQVVRPEMPRQLGKLRNVKSPGGKFVFELESYESPLRVHKLETSLQIASGFIENALVFNTKIKVQANQGEKCVRQGVCEKAIKFFTPGACQSKKIRKAGESGYEVEYPRVLVIQDGVSEEMEYDMEMFIKTCDDCIYPGSYGGSQGGADMINIIIRAMVQGLGLTSNLVGGMECGPQIEFKFEEKYKSAFIKPNLFDSRLYTRNGNIHKKFHNLDYKIKYDNVTDVESLCAHDLVRELEGLLATPDSTYFRTNKGRHVQVATGEKEGDNASHLNKRYDMTKDYLMTAKEYSHGYRLNYYSSAESWSTAPLGSYTLEVLETLGYKLNPNPDPDHSQLALYLLMKEYNHLHDLSH